MLQTDVLVVGAGPAGAVCALNLASTRRVVLVDRQPEPATPIGETLPPAARRLLIDMGLWESFLAESHAPAYGARSVWGNPAVTERDALRDIDGAGWHLDRVRFDQWLRQAAAARGAATVWPASVRDIRRADGIWHARLEAQGGSVPLQCRLVVDAAGRASTIGRGLGGARTRRDKLVCGWMHGDDASGRQSGLTCVEAEADGWWYTAPLPGGRRVVAFHTDADLPAAALAAAGPACLAARAGDLTFIADVLSGSGFTPSGPAGFRAAHSAVLTPASGEGWLAAGDAALAFDPLSSQGLFNALYTGLAAAEATDRALAGDTDALSGYQQALAPIEAAYRSHLSAFYGLERRWADRPFWRRRHVP